MDSRALTCICHYGLGARAAPKEGVILAFILSEAFARLLL